MSHKIIALFPGQGSQAVGMCKQLYSEDTQTKEIFQTANNAIGFDLANICFNGPEDDLLQTQIAQPALLTASIALYWHFCRHYSIEVLAAAGHSLGEYTALVASGAFPFEQAVQLVYKRGILMAKHGSQIAGEMHAVLGSTSDSIQPYLTDNVIISNYNSPQQSVISGVQPEIGEVLQKLQSAGLYSAKLKVSGPFHSQYMEGAARELKPTLDALSFASMKFPVLSNVTAEEHVLDEISLKLYEQIYQPVQWAQTIRKMARYHADYYIDFGPKPTMKRLVTDNDEALKVKVKSVCLQEDMDFFRLQSGISLPTLEAGGYDAIAACYKTVVCTKNRNEDPQDFRNRVLLPSHELIQLVHRLRQEQRVPTDQEVADAYGFFISIMQGKGMPAHDIQTRSTEIFGGKEDTQWTFQN